jgi:hypothetical protein
MSQPPTHRERAAKNCCRYDHRRWRRPSHARGCRGGRLPRSPLQSLSTCCCTVAPEGAALAHRCPFYWSCISAHSEWLVFFFFFLFLPFPSYFMVLVSPTANSCAENSCVAVALNSEAHQHHTGHADVPLCSSFRLAQPRRCSDMGALHGVIALASDMTHMAHRVSKRSLN